MKRSNTQRLKDSLEDDIINGRLAPGERLDPEELAARFQVSRTPIREAIHQLTASGLHQRIYRASHNGFLVKEANQLKQRLKPYRRLQLQVRNRVSNSLSEHRTILAAIRAGDAAAAEDAMREHVLIQGERFSDFIATMKQFNSQAS